ncbi:MAG: hypothetical protein K0U47_05050 [Epsilonproteobacteria bacterium]|nr:hypothetical protein [Campylobacterota bacterium]
MRILLVTLFSCILTFLHAATINTDKAEFNDDENIVVSLTDVIGEHNNWVGLFRVGAPNQWGSVVAENWVGDLENGTIEFPPLVAGDYEARLFYNESLNQVEKTTFHVAGEPGKLIMNQTTYTEDEEIQVTLQNVQGPRNNWVGIFRVGTTNTWGNALQENWLGNKRNGDISFTSLMPGQYEARLFYNETLAPESTIAFTVTGEPATITASKSVYKDNEQIQITVTQVQGVKNNWVGLFRKGTSNNWGAVLQEFWLEDMRNGQVDFNALPPGEYEARLFYNETLNPETFISFEVEQTIVNLPPTLYEDAEDRNTNGWRTLSGPYQIENRSKNGGRVIYGKAHWTNYNGQHYTTNDAVYILTKEDGSPWNNNQQFFLELDTHGGTACFSLGVEVKTKQGYRTMLFSVWFGRKGWGPKKSIYGTNVELVYPLADTYRHGGWHHLRFDLQNYLEQLEPDNKIYSVEAFILTGQTGNGRIDNIKLLSN